MNPNASSFNFSGGAPLFVPGQVRGGHGGQAPVQESWDDEQPVQYQDGQAGQGQQQYRQEQGHGYGYGYGPGQGQAQGYQQQYGGYADPAQMQPQAGLSNGLGYSQPAQQRGYYEREYPSPMQPPQPQAQPKTISIGAPKTSAALSMDKDAGSSSDGLASKAATSSVSGNGSATASKPSAVEKSVASLKEAALPETTPPISASASTSNSTSTSSTSLATASPNISTTSSSPTKKNPEKPASSLSVGPPAAKVERTADQIAEQIAAVAAEDEVKDLYGADGELLEQKEHINVVFIGHVESAFCIFDCA